MLTNNKLFVLNMISPFCFVKFDAYMNFISKFGRIIHNFDFHRLINLILKRIHTKHIHMLKLWMKSSWKLLILKTSKLFIWCKNFPQCEKKIKLKEFMTIFPLFKKQIRVFSPHLDSNFNLVTFTNHFII
jgi:hypothetical protein